MQDVPSSAWMFSEDENAAVFRGGVSLAFGGNPWLALTMLPCLAKRLLRITVLACVTSYSFSNAQESPSPRTVSPDKKWEYVAGDKPKLVKTGGKEAVLEISSGRGSDFSAPVWAPDSKRFAIRCSGGKGDETSVYQLRDDQWAPPEEALGNGDQLMERAGNLIEAQAKKKGLPKKTFLHMIRWTVEPQRWLDASTLIVYASMMERVHRRDGEDVGLGFGTALLVTLKFDDAGKWKIVKTHQMSEKEVSKKEAEERIKKP
jgi:hypothetical protein